MRVQIYHKDMGAYHKAYICGMDKSSLENYQRLGGKAIPIEEDSYGENLPETILKWSDFEGTQIKRNKDFYG